MTRYNKLYDEGTANEHTTYFENNKLHREDGAALVYKDGRQYWFYLDYFVDHCKSQQQFEHFIKLKAFWE